MENVEEIRRNDRGAAQTNRVKGHKDFGNSGTQ